MSACGGNCSACGGCAKELVLMQPELEILRELAQFPFLPVARRADQEAPVYLEGTDDPEKYSLVLQCLEKKSLITLDYHDRLRGFDYAAYKQYPFQGSMALTQRGQQVLELLELQGYGRE